jgi:hypothetical protein
MKKVISLCIALAISVQVCSVQAAMPLIATALFTVGVFSGAVIRISYENSKSRVPELVDGDASMKTRKPSSFRLGQKIQDLKHSR